jgi:hypothetical protein
MPRRAPHRPARHVRTSPRAGREPVLAGGVEWFGAAPEGLSEGGGSGSSSASSVILGSAHGPRLMHALGATPV